MHGGADGGTSPKRPPPARLLSPWASEAGAGVEATSTVLSVGCCCAPRGCRWSRSPSKLVGESASDRTCARTPSRSSASPSAVTLTTIDSANGRESTAARILPLDEVDVPTVDDNGNLPLPDVASSYHGRTSVALSQSEVDVAVPALYAMPSPLVDEPHCGVPKAVCKVQPRDLGGVWQTPGEPHRRRRSTPRRWLCGNAAGRGTGFGLWRRAVLLSRDGSGWQQGPPTRADSRGVLGRCYPRMTANPTPQATDGEKHRRAAPLPIDGAGTKRGRQGIGAPAAGASAGPPPLAARQGAPTAVGQAPHQPSPVPVRESSAAVAHRGGPVCAAACARGAQRAVGRPLPTKSSGDD